MAKMEALSPGHAKGRPQKQSAAKSRKQPKLGHHKRALFLIVRANSSKFLIEAAKEPNLRLLPSNVRLSVCVSSCSLAARRPVGWWAAFWRHTLAAAKVWRSEKLD